MPTTFNEYIILSFKPLEDILEKYFIILPDPKKIDEEVQLQGTDLSLTTKAKNTIQPIGLSVDSVAILVALVTSMVTTYLKNTVEDLLRNIDKTNASLQRLRNTNFSLKSSANSLSNLNSDDAKIKKQIYFDVLKFEEILTNGFKSRLILNGAFCKYKSSVDLCKAIESHIQNLVNQSLDIEAFEKSNTSLGSVLVSIDPDSFIKNYSKLSKEDSNRKDYPESCSFEVLFMIKTDSLKDLNTLKSTIMEFAS
ncbi:hypothetical protein AYI69_g6522 [Smittium culicis]|uniref:COG complex component COG2 C-terminal domain-containing protein n=1 Tax=Smittium culicis TaxID=133412 RepID=A0A1R1XYE3_9FUNG|nr:hypothetical protein AYI69_g6522 [Smittium culicis]